MGETEYWDEFLNLDPVGRKPEGRIIFGENYSNDILETDIWDPIIEMYNRSANNQDLLVTMNDSINGQIFNIKVGAFAPYGPMTGKLLNGKYATARSAGNYLAGMNGITGTFQGKHISGLTYMKLAGAYQQLKKLTIYNAFKIITFGTSFGASSYYGEEEYSGRWIQLGINAGYKKLNKKR